VAQIIGVGRSERGKRVTLGGEGIRGARTWNMEDVWRAGGRLRITKKMAPFLKGVGALKEKEK